MKQRNIDTFNREIILDAKVSNFRRLRSTLRRLNILSYREYISGRMARTYIIKYI